MSKTATIPYSAFSDKHKAYIKNALSNKTKGQKSMSIEEAISIIRRYECCKEHHTASEMAISALTKQVKKRVIKRENKTAEGILYHDYICPECKKETYQNMFVGSDDEFQYCSYCGQAIDWTNIE